MTERAWRIIEPNGTVHTVDESLANSLAAINADTPRESVTYFATKKRWPVAEVLAHGDVSRADLFAALRAMADTFCLHCDFADANGDALCQKFATMHLRLRGMTVCDEHAQPSDDGEPMPHADTLRMLNGEACAQGAVIASIDTNARVKGEV